VKFCKVRVIFYRKDKFFPKNFKKSNNGEKRKGALENPRAVYGYTRPKISLQPPSDQMSENSIGMILKTVLT